MSDDGWYADPSGQHAQRLYLGGTWTQRVRGVDGTEFSEPGPPPTPVRTEPLAWSTAPATGSWAPAGTPPPRDWSTERPSFGLALAGVGAVLALVGIFVLDWADRTSFFDLRRSVDANGSPFSVITQLYTLVLFLPLVLVTVVVGVLASVGRAAARAVTAASGVLGGVGLIGAVVWVETGGVGTDSSRSDAQPALVLMVVVGVLCIVLGAGVIFEKRGYLARGLAVGLAAVAAVLHLYVVADLFQGATDPYFGAWVSAIGYGLLAVAPVLPYRRITHA